MNDYNFNFGTPIIFIRILSERAKQYFPQYEFLKYLMTHFNENFS